MALALPPRQRALEHREHQEQSSASRRQCLGPGCQLAVRQQERERERQQLAAKWMSLRVQLQVLAQTAVARMRCPREEAEAE